MSKYLKCIYCIIINLVLINSAQAWDSDQLEIFDLVEEVNQNFYNLLNVSQVRIIFFDYLAFIIFVTYCMWNF